ncbi:hypothetical protein PPROV_000827600 [Pycnococcus provasolii]|uniref:Uncharacterized protein n=1 Tax=Pycnococcus provasolii TaxID=41880 RepID=A0A830HVS2_9CHLO|nr:hypothetical protein PPROV_000827600 [Pycnococcus provasolii]
MAPAMRMLSTRAMAKEVTVIGFKDKGFRTKQSSTTKRAQLLSRVEELRLLTKAEQAGLLTLAENFGLSLGKIEKLGLLSKAEDLGLIAAASDPGTPGALSAAGLALLALGPAAVYLLPDDSATLVAVQVAVAALCAGGGAAALGASALLGDLQSKKA